MLIREKNSNKFCWYLILTIFVIIFICYTNLLSQNIVISEYFNGATPADGWTEILVIADNISLEFYLLKVYPFINGEHSKIGRAHV